MISTSNTANANNVATKQEEPNLLPGFDSNTEPFGSFNTFGALKSPKFSKRDDSNDDPKLSNSVLSPKGSFFGENNATINATRVETNAAPDISKLQAVAKQTESLTDSVRSAVSSIALPSIGSLSQQVQGLANSSHGSQNQSFVGKNDLALQSFGELSGQAQFQNVQKSIGPASMMDNKSINARGQAGGIRGALGTAENQLSSTTLSFAVDPTTRNAASQQLGEIRVMLGQVDGIDSNLRDASQPKPAAV